MNKSPLIPVLLGILAVSVAASVVLYLGGVSYDRKVSEMLPQWSRIQNEQPIVNALVNDLAAYSQTNKDIEPVLKASGITFNRTNAAAASPAGK
jgi:hypothetical protein